VAGGVALLDGEYELVTQASAADEGDERQLAVQVLPGGGFVVLDLALDDALRAEGFARDVVRQVQDARKAADLHVSDRIDLRLGVPDERVADAETWRDHIARETLATSLAIGPVDAGELARGAVAVVDLRRDESTSEELA
ncbi:MAG: isoleucine--tRNA ligase, partial [Salana multivorans]|nr:isoleucine--tRNA ligase [Salana multivorans]